MHQPERRDMLEPRITDRGLAYMPNIAGTARGTSVNVHDSSNAEHDALWLETRGYHNRDGDGGAAQVTIDDALTLASQICALAERRGYSTPLTRAALAQRGAGLGDPVRVTYPDGATETATIRTIRGDGGAFTAETDPADLPLGHEFAPITGMLGNPLDECGHRADGTELTRCGYPRADHEPDAGYCSVEEHEGGNIVTHASGCDGIQCGNSTVVPPAPQPLVTQVDPNTERLDRVDDTLASMADRLEYLERCYRELPRPQDVGMLAAHLAKIERLEGELAAAGRELKAHKDVLGQIGAEKRQLEAQLDAHHRDDKRRPSHRQVVLIEGLLDAVDRGADPEAHPLDVPPGLAGRVAAALAKARTDAIAAFVSRQSVEYRKHSAEAVKEDIKLAVSMGVPLERLYDPEDVAHVQADLDAEGGTDE